MLIRVCCSFFILLLLSACASTQKANLADTYALRDQGIQEVSTELGYEFGHGVGPTEQDAASSALQELGQTIFVQVRTEIEHIQRSTLRDEGLEHTYESSDDLNIHSQAFSNVEISGHRFDVRQRASDGWYVRARLSRERAVELREELRRVAPLLAYLELLRSTEGAYPGRQLKHALEGLAEADRLGMSDERISSQDFGGISFGAYFRSEINAAMDDLKLLPYMEGNRARFALIHNPALFMRHS